jgi:hypothetical protein
MYSVSGLSSVYTLQEYELRFGSPLPTFLIQKAVYFSVRYVTTKRDKIRVSVDL